MTDTLNIVTVIAVILFARLGVRLLVNYKKNNDSFRNNEDKE